MLLRLIFLFITSSSLPPVSLQYYQNSHFIQGLYNYYAGDQISESFRKFESNDDVSDHIRAFTDREYDDYDDNSKDCNCACETCSGTKKCCLQTCNNCNPSNDAMMLVPYPYPIVVPGIQYDVDGNLNESWPNPDPAVNNSTQIGPDQEHTTLKPKVKNDTNVCPDLANCRHLQYNSDVQIESRPELISRRRNKPEWLPKYGIVPIPDKVAVKLMDKLQKIEELKNRRVDKSIFKAENADINDFFDDKPLLDTPEYDDDKRIEEVMISLNGETVSVKQQ